MNTKMLMMFACALAAAHAFAANKTFPLTSGDIADETNWGEVGLPTSSDNASFNTGTYTMSKDTTFGSIKASGNNCVFDFAKDGKTLKLKTPYNYADNHSIFQYPYWSNPGLTTFSGGVIDCCGNTFNIVPLGRVATQCFTLVLTNGCVVTNMSTSSNSSFARRIDLTLRITDKAKMYAESARLVNGIGKTFVEVADGGLLSFDKSCFFDYYYNANPQTTTAVIDCHGAGSELRFNGGCYIGYQQNGSRDNEIRVRDGATMTAKGVSINFCPGISNNWLRVLDNGTATVASVTMRNESACVQVSNAVMTASGDISIVQDTSTRANNCRVEVLDGGNLWVKGGMYSRQPNCHFLVRDATLKVDGTTSCIGSLYDSCNNSFTLSGSAANLVLNDGLNLMGSAGTNNLLQIEKGAYYRPPSGFIAVQGKDSTCRVTGSGTVLDARTATGGYRHLMVIGEPASGTTTASSNNVFEVSDGALVKADRMFVHGANTSLIVSNATISACSEESGGTTGYALWIGRGGGGSCNLILRGTTPAIRSPKLGTGARPMIVQGDSKIRYEIPSEGYAAGYAPIEVVGLNMASSTATLEISCEAWAAVKGRARTELVLFRTTGGDFGESAKDWFKKQTLNLPENVTCFMRGNEIVLSRKGSRGLRIFFY